MNTRADNPMAKLLSFLDQLDRRRIFRRLDSVRDAVMVPGSRWEVEFFADGQVEIEIFTSDGEVLGDTTAEAALERLLREHDQAEAEARAAEPPDQR